MSSYFDFSVERQREDGKGWSLIAHSDYRSDLEVINPYILKGIFWDTDKFQKYASLKDDLTKGTILQFSEKIERVSLPADEKDPWYKIKKETLDNENYPYKYEKQARNFNFEKNGMLSTLNDLKQKLEYKWNEIEIPFDEKVINEKIDKFSWLFNYELEENEEIKKEIEEKKTIDFFIEKGCAERFRFSPHSSFQDKRIVYVSFDTIWDAEQFLKYQAFKDSEIPTCIEPFVKSYQYYNGSKEVVQYQLKDVKISNYDDIIALINEVEKSLNRYKKACTVENLAKTFIQDNFIENASEEDLKTQLGKDLKKFVKGVDSCEDEEYEEELETQLTELRLLARFVGSNGRLIWIIE
jgi:hypothetical protein